MPILIELQSLQLHFIPSCCCYRLSVLCTRTQHRAAPTHCSEERPPHDPGLRPSLDSSTQRARVLSSHPVTNVQRFERLPATTFSWPHLIADGVARIGGFRLEAFLLQHLFGSSYDRDSLTMVQQVGECPHSDFGGRKITVAGCLNMVQTRGPPLYPAPAEETERPSAPTDADAAHARRDDDDDDNSRYHWMHVTPPYLPELAEPRRILVRIYSEGSLRYCRKSRKRCRPRERSEQVSARASPELALDSMHTTASLRA